MNSVSKKSSLPAIQKKLKQGGTPGSNIAVKKTIDSGFISKTKTVEKLNDFHQLNPPPSFLIPKIVIKDDSDKDSLNIFAQSRKSGYIDLFDSQNIMSTKKTESDQRQSRYEAFIKPIKEPSSRDSSLSRSLSPEKNIKKPILLQSSRSRSEFTRTKTQFINYSNQAYEINELKIIDSMELDNIEESQCEFDGEAQALPNVKAGKKKKGFTALSEMVPLNLEEEKQKFFEKEFKYNPQFEYNMQNFKQHFEKPHKKYLKVAKMILNACMREYKDDEQFMEITGGRLITKEETETYFMNYIKDLELEGLLEIVFSENTVAPTSVIHDPSGKSRVVISLPITYREKRIMGVMHHEIGTHFIRKYNDRMQPWFKNRKKFDLKPYIIIEEGLAALNQTLGHAVPGRQPFLWNSALHYYSCYMSSVLGVEALFKDLEKYIKDPVKRWRECVRVKRGIIDTSQPGGMYKDQVYLRGAIEILKKRRKIDFILLHSGKINLKDLKKMKKLGLIKTDGLKLPSFLKNLDDYKAALDRIAAINFIDTIK